MSRRFKYGCVLALATFGWACASTSPFQGMTAADLQARAEEAMESGDYGGAILAIERLLASTPNYPAAAEVRVMLADSYFAQNDFLTAAAEYLRVLDRYSGSPVSSRAALGVCLSYAGASPIPARDQTYTQQALVTCRTVAADHPGQEVAVSADSVATRMVEKLAAKDYSTGEWYFRRGLFDSAREYYEGVHQRYPESDWAPRALLRLFEGFSKIGYDDLADQVRADLLQRYPDSSAARSLSNAPV